MSISRPRPHPAAPVGHDLPMPERLVGLGFRYWNAGFEHGDIACWEEAWRLYEGALGPAHARGTLCELGCWVRKIRARAGRPIATLPANCRGFCADECVAISLVAASQHQACPAMRACAYTLLGAGAVDEIVAETDNFASALERASQRLDAGSIALANEVMVPRIEPVTASRH